MDCIFCKIIRGESPGIIIHRDEHIIAFDNIYPDAPQHKLIIPQKHISTLSDIENDDTLLLGNMLQVTIKLARTEFF